jgi:hypothetical protein
MGYDHPVEVVDQFGLSETERHMVLRGTAAQLLKL